MRPNRPAWTRRSALLFLALAAAGGDCGRSQSHFMAQSPWDNAQSAPRMAQSPPGIAQSVSSKVQSAPQNSPAFDPSEPYRLPPAKLAQATALGAIRPAIHFGSEAWELLVLVALLASGTAAKLGQWAAGRTEKPNLQAAIFSAALVVLLWLVVDLPFGAIGHVFSLRYGIAIEPWGPWLLDQAKTLLVMGPVEVSALSLAFGLMHWTWSRRRYWLWFAAAAVPAILLGTFLFPTVIEPLFNTFEPLAQSHPALAVELEKVVARTGTSIPPERMFVMKASDKSNGLNAYVTGIGNSKRIVVWDTTADRMPTDEILFTFAHESGHYVLNHIPKGLTLASAGIFALFWAVAKLGEWLVRRFGGNWRISAISSLPGIAVLLLAFTLVQAVTEPLGNAASRYIEHEADVYGQEAIHGLVPNPQATAVAAFNALGEAYLDDPRPNRFVEFWTYDHPSIQRRAIFAAHYDPWTADKHPRFFGK